MSKSIEESKLKVLRPLWKFNIHRKFMCTDKNNDQNNLPSNKRPQIHIFETI